MKFKKGKRFNVQMSPTVEGGGGWKIPIPNRDRVKYIRQIVKK